MIERIAHAKINLSLHVTGQREDGYHLLDSLVVFSEFGDKISADTPHHAHGPIEVKVTGPFGEGLPTGGENLITAAAVLLREAVMREGIEPKPVSIHLTKNLPVASGIGGGSADAAATLLALQEFWESNVDIMPIAEALGADIPMCLYSKPLRAQGIGDEITLLETLQYLNLMLINPGISVSTPQVFKQLEKRNNQSIQGLISDHFPEISEISEMRNDLQKPALELVPQISDVLQALDKYSPNLARMSGSGATCFGIFESIEAAEKARKEVASEHPEWWCVATQTTVS